MEDALRALQQQVNTLSAQNAALEAQLRGQQNVAQGLAQLSGAITTMLNLAQAPTRKMLVDPKGLGKQPVFSCKEKDFYVRAKKVENYVSGVFPKLRGLTFAVESKDAVTASLKSKLRCLQTNCPRGSDPSSGSRRGDGRWWIYGRSNTTSSSTSSHSSSAWSSSSGTKLG